MEVSLDRVQRREWTESLNTAILGRVANVG